MYVDTKQWCVNCMHAYTHVCIYTHIYVYIYTHMCMYVYIYTYMCICTEYQAVIRNTCIYTHTYLHTYLFIYIHIYMYIYIYMRICICMYMRRIPSNDANHMHLYTHTYAYIYVYIYTYIYTYIRRIPSSNARTRRGHWRQVRDGLEICWQICCASRDFGTPRGPISLSHVTYEWVMSRICWPRVRGMPCVQMSFRHESCIYIYIYIYMYIHV